MSPALTGRFALLIFLPLASEEKVMGTSTGRSSSSSISSMSDIMGVGLIGLGGGLMRMIGFDGI